jgi:hypothetical protein
MFYVHAEEFTLKTFGATTQLRELHWRVKLGHGKFVVEVELEVGL